MVGDFSDQPAFVLHSRPYGDTSLIVDCFCQDLGRVSLYARGAKANKKKNARALLNAFSLLLISASGKGSLKNLLAVESVGSSLALKGRALFCGFYLNELLVRLLPEADSQRDLFNYYKNILEELSRYDEQAGDAAMEVLLRTFEWLLVQQVGASFSLVVTADTNQALKSNLYYRFVNNLGLIESKEQVGATRGDSLLKFSVGDLSEASTRHDIKLFMRSVLMPLLGGRPLKSRELFR